MHTQKATRGRWQRALLDALAVREFLTVAPGLSSSAWIGRELSTAERSALHRAVHQLAQCGLCDLGHTYSADDGPARKIVLLIGRTGSAKLRQANVECVPGEGTR